MPGGFPRFPWDGRAYSAYTLEALGIRSQLNAGAELFWPPCPATARAMEDLMFLNNQMKLRKRPLARSSRRRLRGSSRPRHPWRRG
eukprot:5774848-Alexandrium_andersonii.AAC.1